MALGAADLGDVFATLGVSKFVGALDGRDSVVVLDLGPAVGANVMFLGGRLGCKLHVQDVLSDPETWSGFFRSSVKMLMATGAADGRASILHSVSGCVR